MKPKLITIARAYAKAILYFSIEHNNIKKWHSMLTFAVEVSNNNFIKMFLSGMIRSHKLANIFIKVCNGILDIHGRNFIRIMAEYKRLSILPIVLEQFNYLYKEYQYITEIKIVSSHNLKQEQLLKISVAMEKRLSRKVKLTCTVDKNILAGMIIYVGNQVLDYSIRNRLNLLANVLIS